MLNSNSNKLDSVKSRQAGDRIFITGGAGYIGSHIVRMLVENGYQVTVYDNFLTGRRESIPREVEVIEGDIRDRRALSRALSAKNYDAIIHLAALVNAAASVKERDLYYDVNLTGTKNVIDAAVECKIPHFIYASSAAVYGNDVGSDPVSEDYTPRPTSPYGETKLEGEKLLKASGLKYGIFRFFNVIGSIEDGSLGSSPENRAILTRLLSVAAGKKKEIEISGNDYATVDGTVVRDFVSVMNIARAHLLALKLFEEGGDSFLCNLGSGRVTSMKALHMIVEQITGKKIPVVYGPRNAGDIEYSQADITLAQNILHWTPTEGIAQMVESAWKYYENHT